MKNNIRLIIYGCGGHARSILNTSFEIYAKDEIMLVDDNARENEKILGCRVEKKISNKDDAPFIVAVGDNTKRQQIFESRCAYGENPVSIISATAMIGIDSEIDKGTFVAKKNYIGPEVRIGKNSIINTGSIIEHETIIGNHTHIAPGATICGRCRIGNNVLIGAGATVKDCIEICDNVIVGAGAVVINDILEQGTYVGVPAKRIK